MALPTLSTHLSSRSRMAADQLSRRREQEARWRQQWEMHARYFREQNLHSLRQAAWGSRSSFHQSMSAYHNQRLQEEKKANLEQRRDRLRAMLQGERDQLEAELRALVPDRNTLKSRLVQKTEELRTAREDRKKKLAQELLKEHWRKNSPELREAESALHKDYVVSQWQEQISEKKQKEVTEQEEKRHFENEYERSRKEALQRMKQAEERKKEEERKTAEELRKQMEELYLREEEATRLKKEQDALLHQQWELEKIEEERRKMEERQKKTEIRHFLIRQYRAQMKRRAQQVQGELEADRRILAALLEGEQEEMKLETVRRERAVADAAWMKRVIEEQLKLERQREAEFESLHREEAQRVWERREAQWEKERKARERLMREVLMGRQQQLELKMQKNREAQEESLKRREELIQELELERELRRQEKEKEEGRQTARAKDLKAQMEQHQQEQLEEQHLMEQEEEENRKALEIQKQELRLEMQSMAEKGYQEKIHSRPRSAWT
ncbi:trichoplein keratin filament-binding protein [Oryzias latipes]|uniref:Trichoplein keratin filament-binding protein n=1 Tax=Oryzias latipes TaxID=8090 RepID=H2LSW8_ORYLA|nr:trichoplein keratin filament-binding protein [Oryzias latipes]XP_020561607.1 trichoplein keratin filament-binding protein [Oryzias latipes]